MSKQPRKASPLTISPNAVEAEIVAEGEIIPPRRGRKSVVMIDWLVVRQDYENTELTVEAIARRHGIKSATQVRRRIASENWKRDIATIAAKLVTEGVALSKLPKAAAKSRTNEGKAPAQKDGKKTQAKPETCDAPAQMDAARTNASTNADANSHTNAAPQDVRPTRNRDDRDLKTAKGLADIHAQAISEQISIADEALGTALSVMRNLQALMTAEAGSAALGEARGRLMMVSADKETISNLMKSCGALLEGGLVIKRRALGMDVGKGPHALTPLTSPPARSMEEVLRRMKPESLMDARRVALELSRLPPSNPDQSNDEGETDAA